MPRSPSLARRLDYSISGGLPGQRLLDRSWLARVAASNAVSIPLDTLLFSTIAFAGVPGAPSLAQIVVGDLIFKSVISMAFALWKTRANSPPPAQMVVET